MPSPFPGMDPYLEHPSLWPDIHNSLTIAIADALSPLVTPVYFVGVNERIYREDRFGGCFAGHTGAIVVEEVGETFLEIREVSSGRLITLMELLSPVNKLSEEGREQYIRKRADVLRTWTNLVEIDLLRAGKPMPTIGPDVESDYRILISPGWRRPHARLHAFGLRQPIPEISIPLQQGEDEPTLALNDVLHSLYKRAHFDLRLDYTQSPVPPLSEADAAWMRQQNVKREA